MIITSAALIAGCTESPSHNHEGHSHNEGTQEEASSATEASSVAPIEISGELLPTLMKPYLDLQAALAADDLAASKEAGKALMSGTGHEGPLPDLIHKMLAAESLDAMRKPHFETLSKAMISAAKTHPAAVEGELLIMHCPMVHKDRGADWLQSSEPLLNPYFGAKMLKCGNVKGKIPAAGGE